jgi:hypothetical protein
MDVGIWGLIAGSGWASGVNLYLVASLLGGAGRLGLMDVPDVLMRTDVLIAAVVMFLLEFVADKVPLLDSAWDTVHTAIRPLGAALIGYALGGENADAQQLTGAAISGGLALASHLAKATARAAINASPEPVSNVVASVAEDGMVVGVVALAVAAPMIAIAVVGLLLVTGTALAFALASLARRGRRRWRERQATRRGRPPDGARQPR